VLMLQNGKAEVRLERCNSRLKGAIIKDFLQGKTRLGMEQLLFNTLVLINPRTWCKNITNKLLQNLVT
jgi:hypothetical protein